MTNIRILTDSTADLPQEIVEQYQITVIPLTVLIEGKPYLDRVDITNEEYYATLRKVDDLPTTSQPSPAVFAEAYEKLAQEGCPRRSSLSTFPVTSAVRCKVLVWLPKWWKTKSE